MKTQKHQVQVLPDDLDLSKYGWEALLAYREKLNAEKENAEAGLKVINDELLLKLQEEKISGKIVGSWSISKATRTSYDLSVQEARALGATKETVDQAVLKNLKAKGIEIPNEKRTEYVLVREIVAKNNETE